MAAKKRASVDSTQEVFRKLLEQKRDFLTTLKHEMVEDFFNLVKLGRKPTEKETEEIIKQFERALESPDIFKAIESNYEKIYEMNYADRMIVLICFCILSEVCYHALSKNPMIVQEGILTWSANFDALCYWASKHIAYAEMLVLRRTQRTGTGGAKGMKDKGSLNARAIEQIMLDMNISSPAEFRSKKALREKFLERARKATEGIDAITADLRGRTSVPLSDMRIIEIARRVSKNGTFRQ